MAPLSLLLALTVGGAAACLALFLPGLWDEASRRLRLALAGGAFILSLLLLPWRAVATLAATAGACQMILRLSRRRSHRLESRRCLEDLPTLVDSLVLGMEAGQSLFPAFLETRQVLPPLSPLSREISHMEESVRLGLPQAAAIE